MTLRDEEPGVRAPGRFERPWLRSRRPVPRRIAPLERFLREETGSGALLLAAALAALAWSNVATESYEEFWSTRLVVELGALSLEEDLRHLVNDLLMALFFYVVVLEVKRELVFGSLSHRATAAVPIAAALGTMVGAAVTYLAVNIDGGSFAAGRSRLRPTSPSRSLSSTSPDGERPMRCAPSCSRSPWSMTSGPSS